MKREVLIYGEDKEVLELLRSFFRKRDDFSTRFVIEKDKGALQRELEKKRPDVLIVGGSAVLDHLSPSEFEFPVIALISPGNMINDIRSLHKSGVEYYLLSAFDKEDLEETLNVAVKKKSWLENLFKEKREPEALMWITYLLSSTLNPKEVLFLIVKKISEILNVSRCSILRLDMENQRYAYVISTSEDLEVTDIRLDLYKYPEIRRSLYLDKPVIVRDALKDPMMKEVSSIISLTGIRSILVIPIILPKDVIGTLLLRASRIDRPFTEREIRVCISVANASANALYNAFLYEKLEAEKKNLENLAITDYLTGVYNIRYFYKRLDEEFSRAERYRMPLGCIMFDIDRFKRINDTYGHRVGDIILREFAQLVRAHIRKSDVFARYGGEEFIMLLPQTSPAGAIAEAERLSKIVREYRFSALSDKEGITMSIGIACSPDEKIKTPDDLITFADNALFTAKRKGRNQIVTHPSLTN